MGAPPLRRVPSTLWISVWWTATTGTPSLLSNREKRDNVSTLIMPSPTIPTRQRSWIQWLEAAIPQELRVDWPPACAGGGYHAAKKNYRW